MVKTKVIIKPSNLKNKKFTALLNGKKIHFGAKGYSDYTLHKDTKRRDLYLDRHKKREDWTIKGIETAGFWARWLLWNETTIRKSINFLKKKFDLDITLDF
jgi:hypothetical protein